MKPHDVLITCVIIMIQNDSVNSLLLLESGIIPLLVFMASKATQLSRQWILKDLEVSEYVTVPLKTILELIQTIRFSKSDMISLIKVHFVKD